MLFCSMRCSHGEPRWICILFVLTRCPRTSVSPNSSSSPSESPAEVAFPCFEPDTDLLAFGFTLCGSGRARSIRAMSISPSFRSN